jgi:hypothetical protein
MPKSKYGDTQGPAGDPTNGQWFDDGQDIGGSEPLFIRELQVNWGESKAKGPFRW